MKKWIALPLLLLCLSGCAGRQTPVDRPPSLEIEYGESAVYATTGSYQWIWRNGRDTASSITDAADPRSMLDKLPYLNASKADQLKLQFATEPDKLTVTCYSGTDSYQSPTALEIVDYTLDAPLDEKDHLYEVTAVWQEDKKADFWGSCTYHFRFLSQGVISSGTQMPQYSDLSLFQLVQLDSSALLGVEFLNNVDGQSKTCRTQQDKTAILDFLKENLSADLQSAAVPTTAADYALRIVCVDGTQLSLSYGTANGQPWLLAGSTPYAAGSMDLSALWNTLEAGSVSQQATASGKHYLSTSDAFPGDSWGNEFVYGYLTGLDSTASYDEMRWIDDDTEPNGYRLENGWAGQSMPLADDCQFWILDNHDKPYGQVSSGDLLDWAQSSDTVLFRFYTRNNQIIAICEQYQP